MKKLLFLLLPLLIIACKQNKTSEMTEGNHKIDTLLFQKKLKIKQEKVQLAPKANEVTSNWLAYVTAQSEIENFHNYTVKEVISNAKPIAEIMRSLFETVPDSLNSNAVRSRIDVLYTKARVLEQLSEKRFLHPKEIKTTAEELPQDFNNFKIQINELFLKSLGDFEKELDKKAKTQDSISKINAQKADSLPREIN